MSFETSAVPAGAAPSRRLVSAILALALTGWLATWGGRFPATMTPDSLDQWNQVVTGAYNDWHPAAHTFLLWAMTRLWTTPAAIIALHLILMTWLLGSLLRRILAMDCGRGALWLIGLFYALHPVHGLMLSTLWKDIPFAMAVAAFTLLIIRLCREPDRFSPSAMLGLLACATAITLLRHQGVAISTLSLLGVMFAFPGKRRMTALVLLALLAITAAWRTTVRHALALPGSPITEALAIPLQQTVTIVSNQGRVTPAQRDLLEAVAPWSLWHNPASRQSIDWLKFDPDFSATPIQQNPSAYFRLWLELMVQNPGLSVRGWLRQTMILWHPGLNAAGVDASGIPPNPHALQPAPWSDSLARFSTWLQTSVQRAPLSWSLRPSWCHALLLFAGFQACRRYGWRGVLPFLPVAVLGLTLMFLIPVPDFRYFYPSFLVAPLLLVHALRGVRPGQPVADAPAASPLSPSCP